MFSSFERMVAFRYLRARRQEGFISVIAVFSLLGIALGVATLIVVMAVMNGVREELIKSIIGLEGHVTIVSATPGQGITNFDAITEKLTALPGVKSALPKVEGQVMLTFKGRSAGVMVAGYRDEDLPKKPLLAAKLAAALPVEKEGSGPAEASQIAGHVVMGKRLAERLGIRAGDEITLISPEGRMTVVGMVPRIKSYTVAGMFSLGMFAYDNGMVLLPFDDAQLYFHLAEGDEPAASSVELMLDNPENAAVLAQEIANRLGSGFRVYEWKSSNQQIFQAVLVQRNVMFLILTLIILVASFNIISSLIMLVKDKGREIAILRTVGATRGMVLRIFFLCGASIGFMGTAAGLLLGLLIASYTEEIQLWLESLMGHRLFTEELYFLSHLPARINPAEVVAVVLLGLGLSFLATIYPARRASKLDPAEALRYE